MQVAYSSPDSLPNESHPDQWKKPTIWKLLKRYFIETEKRQNEEHK
ncbi:hypothetical protein BH10CYA1_BH10CYA1_04280 [soil metagenome]